MTEKSTRWRQSSRRRVWQPRAPMPFFVLGHFPFTYVLVYGRKKADKSAQRTLFDTRERQNRNEDSLSLSKELFFPLSFRKKRERKKKTKMHAATHHGQQIASFVSLGENGGKRHRLRARSSRLRSGERRSKKDRIRNNASSSNNNNNNNNNNHR